jgi:hypothetical protein
MRRIFIAMIAGGLLLVSGVAASAKLDSATAEQGQKGQQQNQTQQDRKPAVAPAAKSTTQPSTKPAAKPATRLATPVGPTSCTAQAVQTGEFQGEHQEAGCNGQQDQSGVNESATEANDQGAANGNNED